VGVCVWVGVRHACAGRMWNSCNALGIVRKRESVGINGFLDCYVDLVMKAWRGTGYLIPNTIICCVLRDFD